jgi:hypothetical protein
MTLGISRVVSRKPPEPVGAGRPSETFHGPGDAYKFRSVVLAIVQVVRTVNHMGCRQSEAVMGRCLRPRRAGTAMVTIATLLLSTSVFAESMPIRSGHAGHWYAADRSGEGWVLELRDAGGAWLYWFTYDEQGRQRWLTAGGNIVADGDSGERIDFSQLVVTRGARFGPDFDPDDVVHEAVGSASFRFDGCDSGQFSYNAFGQSQTFDVQRLARVMGTRCETPHGVIGREVADHAGQSGSWYDPGHNGEGYALHWATPDQAIVTWYSYDDEGNQYWMLGTGQFDSEGRIHFPDVHATRGARFGSAFDPDDVERFAWGELTFDLACDGGSSSYASILPAFGSGQFELTRLTSLHEVACPWQRPGLTDLYDIEVTPLPSAIADYPGEQVLAFRAAMDDDGLIWTTQSTIWGGPYSPIVGKPLSLQPGAQEWVVMEDLELTTNHWLALRSGVATVNGRPSGTADVSQPMRYLHGTWAPLDPSLPSLAVSTGASRTGNRMLGVTLGGQGDVVPAWHWEDQHGQVDLPGLSASVLFPASAINPILSNEQGTVVFGVLGQFFRPMREPFHHMYVWRDGGAPERIVSADGWVLALPGACNADCTLVFGGASHDLEASDPFSAAAARHEPWIWFEDSRHVRYLGQLELPSPIPPAYGVGGVSPDGSLVVGGYGIYSYFSSMVDGVPRKSNPDRTEDSFVWTPLTGMVSLGRVLDSMGAEPASWRQLDLSAVSPDGRQFVVTEGRTFYQDEQRDLALITLRPRGGY